MKPLKKFSIVCNNCMFKRRTVVHTIVHNLEMTDVQCLTCGAKEKRKRGA